MNRDSEPDAQKDLIIRRLGESAEIKRRTADICTQAILNAATLLAETFEKKGTLFLCGNGGSAADCQHLAAEFVGRLTGELTRDALPAIALTTDSSFLTAYSNDFGFSGVFSRQVAALGKPDDVLLGISTSGGSENIVLAFEEARARKLRTIALTGGTGGKIASLADIAIVVPSDTTQYIQETHVAIEHLLCELVENMMFL